MAQATDATLSGGNVTGITDQPAAEGLVDGVDVEGDRCAYRVRITAKGCKLFNEMARQHEGWIVDAFASLSDKDIAWLAVRKASPACGARRPGSCSDSSCARPDRIIAACQPIHSRPWTLRATPDAA